MSRTGMTEWRDSEMDSKRKKGNRPASGLDGGGIRSEGENDGQEDNKG